MPPKNHVDDVFPQYAHIAGDFQADLDLSGVGVLPNKPTLRSTSIAGDLAGNWNIIGIMGKLTVTGTADHSTVRSTSSMLGLTLGRTDGSDFLAGIDDAVVRHTTDHSDFANALASIKFITISLCTLIPKLLLRLIFGSCEDLAQDTDVCGANPRSLLLEVLNPTGQGSKLAQNAHCLRDFAEQTHLVIF